MKAASLFSRDADWRGLSQMMRESAFIGVNPRPIFACLSEERSV